MVRPEGFEPPIPAFGGLCVIQLRYGRTRLRARTLRGGSGAGNVLEQVEFVIDEGPIELAHAVGMAEKIRARVGQIVARAIRNVMRDLDFLHLHAVNRVGTEIARDGRHDGYYLGNGIGRLLSAADPV